MSDTETPKGESPSVEQLIMLGNQNGAGRISVSLNEIQSLFVSDVYKLGDGRDVIFHASRDGGMVPVFVEPLDKPLPDRITASETFIEPDSLIAYIEAFRRPEMIAKASLSNRTIVVVLDYHTPVETPEGGTLTLPAEVGAGTHKATLDCLFDPDFAKWKALFDKPIPQEAFGDLVEDMIHTIADPAAAELITAVRDIEIDRVSKIKSKINKRDGTTNLILEEVDTAKTTSYSIPTAVTLAVPVFQGGPLVGIMCYLRYSIDQQGLKFKLVPPGLEKTIRDEFRRIAEEVRRDTSVPIYYTA